ncbi:hypothetical protein Ocin01_17118 [Orchesella cincta]|uniref:Uncharacterized protein n=1 Tax=Orchesella cincta TaxID=48709 RepID=A0A1D2M9B3_ORCCI|nr:hypothetical protein Ocin01_17118 [Orchesella cincta]
MGKLESNYAVFPGKQFYKVDPKLQKLCRIHNLGLVDKKVDDLKHVDYYSITPGPRFRWSCKVKNEQTVVRIDDKFWGGKLAAAEMYKHLTDPMKGNLPPLADVQLLDYFAVGAECPTLTQIFGERGLIPNPPEGNKREWMLENIVTNADIDSCLHDPSNSSSYLDNNGNWVSANAKLEYKMKLEEAAKKASPGGLTYPERKYPVVEER